MFMPIKNWQRVVMVVLSTILTVAPSVVLTVCCMAVVAGMVAVNWKQSSGWVPPENGEYGNAD